MGSGASYELICFVAFAVTLAALNKARQRSAEKSEAILILMIVGLFFGISWEPQGTGLVCLYQGYSIYTFMDIPLALLLSWSWWMVVCNLLADTLRRVLGMFASEESLLISFALNFLSGVIVAMVVEPLSVAFGWWEYLVVGKNAVLRFPTLSVEFHLTVVVGWGLLVALNLDLASKVEALVSWIRRKTGFGHSAALVLSCASLGLFSGWLSWQLAGFFAAFMEGEAPRLFFTRYHIIILEGVSAFLVIGILFIGAIFFLCLRTNE